RWKRNGHHIVMYPDASGKNRKSTDASTSDIAQLQNAGFEIRAKSVNPAVKDRVASVNKALESGRLMVNEQACPVTARCLEQQAY
ncbi:terminase, partial [Salmonella enterica subsp. enterica serovar Enteritidis]